MTGQANPARGEAALMVGGEALTLRPTFAALVGAEAELGPLFALVERASAGEMRLSEMAVLFWHCIDARTEGLTRERVGEAVVAMGLVKASPVLKAVLRQVLMGA